MAKERKEMAKLGRQHIADNLTRFYPFLRQTFRVIKQDEIQSEKVFKELFGDDVKVDLEHLRAIYIYQQCSTKTKETSTGSSSPSSLNESTD